MASPSGTPRAAGSSAGSRPEAAPLPRGPSLTTPTARLLQAQSARLGLARSGRRDDLAPPVRATRRARDVRKLGVMALRATDQRRCTRLPLRATRTRVAA